MNGLTDWKVYSHTVTFSQPTPKPLLISCMSCYGTGRELINYAPGAIIEYPFVQKKCLPCTGHGVPPIPAYDLGIK